MRIHLVRHAETIWHNEDRYAGHSEIELTEGGIEQSNFLRDWSSHQKIDAIYTSALNRSILTARPTAIALNLEPQKKVNLNEVNFGAIEGLTKIEFRSKFPDLWQEFQNRPANTKFPLGETGEEALQRALRSISDMLSFEDYSEILVVSHGTLIRLILTHLLSKDLNHYRELFPIIDNVGITTISLDNVNVDTDSNFRLYRYNSKLT